MPAADSALKRLAEAYEKKEVKFLEAYFDCLRIPSVSSEPRYRDDMRECARWLVEHLSGAGFEARLWETGGHPVVFAESGPAEPSRPTVLIYNHYDVQPVDPVEAWETPPFEPTVRDGQVYARGAVDNKGQCLYVIQALKTLLDLDGRLPVKVKLCIDGEEESASPGLSKIVKDHGPELAADHLLLVDGGFASLESPSVGVGVRGIVSLRVEVVGSRGDLHSGTHGGVVYNPLHALVEILGRLRDEEGRITVPGFYDEVAALTEEERRQFDFHFNAARYEARFGARPVGGERAYGPRESGTIRPTLEINGLAGGYGGDGFKTVIPARARANLSCRLVPNQDPEVIGGLVADFIKLQAPEGVEVRVSINPGMGRAVRNRPDAAVVQAAAQAYQDVLGRPCGFRLGGGSIPIMPLLMEASGAKAVLMGLSLDQDNVHAPNEHFGLDRLKMGCLTLARTLELLAET